MSSFKIVKNTFDLKTSDEWNDADKFDSYNTVKTYKGREYRLISKKERYFSTIERIGRGVIGTLAVVCSLGLALLAKPVKKLFTKEKKSVRYAILLNKTTQDIYKDLRGTDLKTNKALISQLMKDYSGISHVTLDGKIVDMGTPDFAENRGSELKPPKTLQEMFPEEIKAFFGDTFDNMAPKIALLLQQGIAAEPAIRALEFIEDPIPDTTFFPSNTYPAFDFSKIGNEFFLLVTTTGSLKSTIDFTDQRSYTVTQRFNLTNPSAKVEMKYIKD